MSKTVHLRLSLKNLCQGTFTPANSLKDDDFFFFGVWIFIIVVVVFF